MFQSCDLLIWFTMVFVFFNMTYLVLLCLIVVIVVVIVVVVVDELVFLHLIFIISLRGYCIL
ncbi:hypothetical protein V1511DRAFT_503727 [Dipodascopsis uninucleata]